MKNIYHSDIVEILLDCSSNGMRVKNIARRIYNRHADLFASDIDYDEIQRSTGRYLWEQAQRRETPFCHTRWGTYAIKTDFAIQLDFLQDLDFLPHQEVHREPAAPAPPLGPKHIQLELF